MTSAQRRKRLLKFKKKKIERKSYIKVALLSSAIIAFLLFLFSQSKFWDKNGKLTLVINQQNGDVLVSTFDTTLEEITSIIIPADTEVEVSRQYGTWKIKSVWQLGKDEELNGQLLAETVTKYFKFPTYAWADKEASGFSEGGLSKLLTALFASYDSNLKFGDKVKIAIFAAKVKNTKRANINLKDTRYLRRAVLSSEEGGYKKSGIIPQGLAVIFVDNEISKENIKIAIKDGTQKFGLAEEVSELVGVLGAKVVSVTKIEEPNFDCEVLGKKVKIRKKIARVLLCDEDESLAKGNFDIEIILGKEFAKRY